jgi:hypothetical protein
MDYIIPYHNNFICNNFFTAPIVGLEKKVMVLQPLMLLQRFMVLQHLTLLLIGRAMKIRGTKRSLGVADRTKKQGYHK